MKVKVEKIQAAKLQLKSAIKLFFEEVDPISPHTLAHAALTIFLDHIPSDEVWKYDLRYHYNTILVKDEYRSDWFKITREAPNFFKHADRDIKAGKTAIEFETRTTEFVILEAIQCIDILEGKGTWGKEAYFSVFWNWFVHTYPTILNDEGQQALRKDSDGLPVKYTKKFACYAIARSEKILSSRNRQSLKVSRIIRGP